MAEMFEKRHIKHIEKESGTDAGEVFEKPEDDKEQKGKEPIQKESRANKILELAEKSADLTIRKISEILKVSFNCANNDIRELVRAGLIETREINHEGKRTKLIFLSEDEKLKKFEEETKGTKETKIREIEKKEEEYLVNFYTAVWNFLDELKKNPNLLKERMASQQFRMLKILKKRGIIKIEEGGEKEINWGKFRELRAYAVEGKILELLDKDQKREMTVNKISSELKIPVSAVRERVKILKEHGLLETNVPRGRTEIIFKTRKQ